MSENNPQQLKKEVLHKAKWLCFKKIQYRDAKGIIREWETVERETPSISGVYGVEILGIVRDKQRGDKLIITRQYRPPLNSFTLEFPAGLLDKGETIEQSALRELKEETRGYSGKIVSTSPPLCLEPGMSDGCTAFVRVDIDGELEENKKPIQHLEDDESIEVLLLPLKGILKVLEEFAQKGNIIDAKLYTFAFALETFQ